MKRNRRILLAISSFLIVVTVVLFGVRFKYDCEYVCSFTGSRKGYTSYLRFFQQDLYVRTKLQEWADDHGYEYEHNWIQIKGTTTGLFSKRFSHSRPPEIYSVPVQALDRYVSNSTDSDIRKLLDTMQEGNAEEKKELVDKIVNSAIDTED